MTGMSVTSGGGWNGRERPGAEAGFGVISRRLRYPVNPIAATLMMTPLMIWSAAMVIDSQRGAAESSMAASDRDQDADEQRRRDPENRPPNVGREGRLAEAGRDEADERRGQHHALDADVHDPGALVHDPAQGAEGDRRREPEDDGRDAGTYLDEVADELEEDAEDRDAVHDLHQAGPSAVRLGDGRELVRLGARRADPKQPSDDGRRPRGREGSSPG